MLDFGSTKPERDGVNVQAYAKCPKEIEQYVAEHRDEKTAAGTVENFGCRDQDPLPAEFVKRIISTLDAKRNDANYSLRADIAYTSGERNRPGHRTNLTRAGVQCCPLPIDPETPYLF